jgi:hypothetical protein
MHIAAIDVNAWFDPSRLSLTDPEFVTNAEFVQLEAQVATQVFSRLRVAGFPVDTWTDVNTTPKLIKSIIAMLFGAWYYDRTYAEQSSDERVTTYANLLRGTAEANIAMLVAGLVTLEELPTLNPSTGQPSFFPNDLSSVTAASAEFPENGPPAFTMGQVF